MCWLFFQIDESWFWNNWAKFSNSLVFQFSKYSYFFLKILSRKELSLVEHGFGILILELAVTFRFWLFLRSGYPKKIVTNWNNNWKSRMLTVSVFIWILNGQKFFRLVMKLKIIWSKRGLTPDSVSYLFLLTISFWVCRYLVV